MASVSLGVVCHEHMTRVQIRSFLPNEWEAYRDTRLAALQDSPDAFGSTYALSSSFDDDVWRSRLQALEPDADFPIVAMVDGAVGGMAWAKITADEPNTAHLFQMWVVPEFRCRGIARQMLHASIEWAQRNGAPRIELAVTLGDSPARRLYESVGFEPDGEPEPLRDGSAIEVQPMVLAIPGGARRAAGSDSRP